MKPGSDAAGIVTLANLRFAYEFSYKNSHKNKSVSEVWKAARKKISQGAEVFLLYFLMNPSVFLK